MTGTSMASPYVAGVVGLMLAVEPKLTAAQILGILKATAQPLPGGTYEWVNDCGFGVISPAACIKAAGERRRPQRCEGARSMKMTMLPSEKGDCLLIEAGGVAILADGGMPASYAAEVRPFLGKWAAAGQHARSGLCLACRPGSYRRCVAHARRHGAVACPQAQARQWPAVAQAGVRRAAGGQAHLA